jgi:hypothetical protein
MVLRSFTRFPLHSAGSKTGNGIQKCVRPCVVLDLLTYCGLRRWCWSLLQFRPDERPDQRRGSPFSALLVQIGGIGVSFAPLLHIFSQHADHTTTASAGEAHETAATLEHDTFFPLEI